MRRTHLVCMYAVHIHVAAAAALVVVVITPSLPALLSLIHSLGARPVCLVLVGRGQYASRQCVERGSYMKWMHSGAGR
jgi:hypothetical protein